MSVNVVNYQLIIFPDCFKILKWQVYGDINKPFWLFISLDLPQALPKGNVQWECIEIACYIISCVEYLLNFCWIFFSLKKIMISYYPKRNSSISMVQFKKCNFIHSQHHPQPNLWWMKSKIFYGLLYHLKQFISFHKVLRHSLALIECWWLSHCIFIGIYLSFNASNFINPHHPSPSDGWPLGPENQRKPIP